MALLAPPGSTNGPVDMSLSFAFYIVELGNLMAALAVSDEAAPLRARLVLAEANAESNGASTVTLLLSPLEQGLIMGALGNVTCQFSCGLRSAIKQAVSTKLRSLGADLGR